MNQTPTPEDLRRENQTPTPEDLRREDQLWAARARGDLHDAKTYQYVMDKPAAWLAYKLWYTEGWPITEAARKMNVTREEVMHSFEGNNPVRYKLFMAKLHMALRLADALAKFHSRLKRLHDAIDRWASKK